MMTRRSLFVALALTFVLLPGVSGADAQEQSIVVEGRVQWISGQRLVVAPVGGVVAPAGTSAINVDLSRVRQDEYSGLATGDAIQVVGTVAPARDRIVATSIRRLGLGSEGAASRGDGARAPTRREHPLHHELV
jgi:lipopolysaccharide export system protein LptA